MEKTDIEKPEDSKGFKLWKIMMLWQKEIKNILEKEFEISYHQYVVLVAANHFKTENIESTQIMISNYTKIEPMSISKLLNSLKEKGLIRRKNSGEDSRVKIVEITYKGIHLVNKIKPEIESIDKEFFSILGRQKNKDFTKYINLLLKNS